MKTKGFSVVEAIMIIVVVAVVGFVGYLAYTNFFAPKDTKETSQTTEQDKPVKVESNEDLDTAISELDSVSIEEESEETELDTATNEFES